MRSLLALLIGLLLGASADAAFNAGGYTYQCATAGVSCDGVRVTYIEPSGYAGTNGEADDTAFVWVGLSGNTHGTQCTLGSGNNNPLIQFGTTPVTFSNGTQTHQTWYEEFPCNNVTNYGSLAVSAGDSLTVELLCTSNCTAGDATGVWQMTWTNNTTGLNQQRTDTNWQVFGDKATAVIEGGSAGSDSASYQPLSFGRMKFSNFQVHYGGSWHSVPIDGSSLWVREHMHFQIVTSPVTQSLYGASPPIGPSGIDFYVCQAITVTAGTGPPNCPASAYGGSAGLGP